MFLECPDCRSTLLVEPVSDEPVECGCGAALYVESEVYWDEETGYKDSYFLAHEMDPDNCALNGPGENLIETLEKAKK